MKATRTKPHDPACRACGHRWGGPPSRIDGLAAYVSDMKEVRVDGRD